MRGGLVGKKKKRVISTWVSCSIEFCGGLCSELLSLINAGPCEEAAGAKNLQIECGNLFLSSSRTTQDTKAGGALNSRIVLNLDSDHHTQLEMHLNVF